jgi:septal ring factor EnvC (AmiA/AmiB activator)
MKMAIPAKFIWPAAMLVVALVAFFAGGYRQRSEQLLSSQTDLKQLQAKDQMIQSQEAQLTQTRQQLNDNSNQLVEMKTKLEESQKELSAIKQRLGAATREVGRLIASRSVVLENCIARAARPCSWAGGGRTAQPESMRRPGIRRSMKLPHLPPG